jgi:Ni,Fe-hydrogenase III small subunit/formate hydrogenlyase subunit 6/NADH:ubiquinone oxidoreductase subunit I
MFVLNTIAHRIARGCQTMQFPKGTPPEMPDRFPGALHFDASKCTAGCRDCAAVCPTDAIRPAGSKLATLDLGACIFCGACIDTCEQGAVKTTGDYRMAARTKDDLVLGKPGQEELRLAAALDAKLKKLFGRSLRLRQVSAGGCNACEADINVLSTIGWDLGRFGIQVVASPRHADGLLITGPVTKNMELALRKTYDAIPDPKIVIAVGTCAISGGLFAGSGETAQGADNVVPVDLYIPGCPPHPLTILDGILRLLGKV